MPHIIVEHSANLNDTHDMAELARQLSDAAMETGIFPLAGIRVRMHPVDVFAMADGHPENSFVAIIVRIGAGRDLRNSKKRREVSF